MKKVITFILACTVCSFSNAQNFDWTKTAGGIGSEYGNSLALDAEGNIYATGTFDTPTDFDPGSGVFTLTPDGTDAFVQKLDRHGNFEWAFQIGGTTSNGAEIARGITVDNSGNVLVTGDFMYTVDFDPSASVNALTSQGNFDAFAAKYDPIGNLLWVKTIGGTQEDNATCIGFDSNDNILIGGNFSGAADFDPGAGSTTFSASGRDGYVVKLDANGNFVWAQQFGAANHQYVTSLNVDLNDDIEVVGYFQSTMDADPGAGVVNLPGSAAYDAYIVKLNSAGVYQWSGGLYGANNEVAYDVTSDNLGNVIYTGYFASPSIDADPTAGTTTLTNGGGYDAFVIKFSPSGAYQWGFSIGAAGNDNGYSVNVNSSNDVYISGFFYSSTDFDPGVGVTILSTIGLTDLFIAKYDASSNLIWVKAAGGINDDIPRATAIDQYENVVTTGWFLETSDLNPDAGTYNVTAVGASDAFVMKMKTCSSSSSSIAADFCGSYTSPSGLYTWTNAGTYSDTILNATGCDSVLTITLTQLSVDIGTSVSDTTITSDAGSATGYQWIDCNTNLPIAGAIAQSYSASANGDYAVIVTMNGCSDTSACTSIEIVGMDETTNGGTLSIYPNPSNGSFTIQAKTAGTYRIVNAMGQIIEIVELNEVNNFTREMRHVGPGLYYLMDLNNGLSKAKKLVVSE